MTNFTGNYPTGIVLNTPSTQNPSTIAATATVTNTGTAVAHNGDAVYGTNAAAWTLTNYGTVNGSLGGARGIDLAAGGTVTNAAGGFINGDRQGVAILGAPGTVTNLGTIQSNHPTAYLNRPTAILLPKGGVVVNGDATHRGALINGGSYSQGVYTGGYRAVQYTNAAATVTNFGTIASTRLGGIVEGDGGTVANYGTVIGGSGVFFMGGLVTNASNALIQGTGSGEAIYVFGPAHASFNGGIFTTVVNAGTIADLAAGAKGIVLSEGGTVSNTGTILGDADGIIAYRAVSTVSNSGTIVATGTTGKGVYLTAGGTARNSGLVEAGINGVLTGTSGAAVVVNSGTILTTDTNTGAGVAFHSGGTVSNAAAGKVTGYNNAVFVSGSAGTVSNLGTLASTGTASLAVDLTAGGTVTNGAADSTAALISGGNDGVAISGGAGTAINFGTIRSTATAGAAVGIIGTAGGTVANYGTIKSTTSGTLAVGVALRFGGVVTNGSAGSIIADRTAIYIGGNLGTRYPNSRGTVTNFGTVQSTGKYTGVSMVEGGLVTNSGLITAGNNGVFITGSAGTVSNLGTIAHTGTGTSGDAVYLAAGGSVINYGLISGAPTGAPATAGTGGYPAPVTMHNTAGTVFNFGTITSPNLSNGVNLDNGGLIVNGSATKTTAVIYGQHGGIYMGGTSGVPTAGAIGTVINYGTVVNGSTAGQAVRLTSGGTVLNHGLLSSLRTGISFGGTVRGTVDNFGTVVSTAASSATAGSGIYMQAAGIVTNEAGGTIQAVRAAINFNDTAGTTASIGTVINLGTVVSTGTTNASGVSLSQGGTLTNRAGAVIAAYLSAVVVKQSAGTTANFGTIASTAGAGVYLGQGGIVTNGSAGATSGLISGLANGVVVKGAVGTVVNYATIGAAGTFGAAVYLAAGGSVTNGPEASAAALIAGASNAVAVFFAAGTVVNYATIAGTGASGYGVVLSNGGTVTNSGTIIGPSAGVEMGGLGTVVNTGTILGTGIGSSGVLLKAGGSVANLGLIGGASHGVAASGSAITVGNLGTIVGTSSAAISLGSGGTVTNGASSGLGASGEATGFAAAPGALVSGAGGALYVFGGTGIVINYGTLASSRPTSYDGVYLAGGGTVHNDGLIKGLDGVDIRIGGTLENDGTIIGYGSGNVAGIFLGFTYTAGAFQVTNSGTVASSAGAIILRGAGNITNAAGAIIKGGATGISISGIGTIDNFGTILGTSGIAISLGSATDTIVIEQGSTLSGAVANFQGSDAIDVPFITYSSTNTATLNSSNLLTISGGGTTATVQLDSKVAGKSFAVGKDASGGTKVTLSGAATTPPAPSGLKLAPGSDTGTLGDNITSVATPEIDGSGEVGDTVTLLDSGASVGTGTVLTGGTWAITTSTLSVGTHTLTATEKNSSGGVSPASSPLTLTITQKATATLFDFIFVYNDGKDYYLGAVADDGSIGYLVGGTLTTSAGTYSILGKETTATSEAPGTVFVTTYSHGGVGLASPTPLTTASGLPDGTNGIGSEKDTLSGVDQLAHSFSGTQEASFSTTALFGFVYTYADGTSYSGTVADDSFSGLPGSKTITDSAGNTIGSYTIFSDGVSGRAAGTVVVDRYSANGQSFTPIHSSATAVDGTGGLGSEQGSITVDGKTVSFSDLFEPAIPSALATAPTVPAPSSGVVVTDEVDAIFSDILGRVPTASELDTYSAELNGGTSVASIRSTLANSDEAQHDLDRLYQQVFDRSATGGELGDGTTDLVDGSSLKTVQLLLADSSEAQSDINQVYLDVLNRNADAGGLASDIAELGDETPTTLADPGGKAGLDGVRDILAHSGEAADDLKSLFNTVLGRDPGAAELVGMEDQLAVSGTTQSTLKTSLQNTGSAGGFTTITVGVGSTTLTAAANTPTLFLFNDIAFGADTITGFDATRDTIRLPKTLVADQTTLKNDTTSSAGGSLITLNATHSIFISNVAPTALGSTNFLIV